MSVYDNTRNHYFSPVEGHVVARYGTPGHYIGARYEKGRGFVINPEAVVVISDVVYRKYLSSWKHAVRAGSLIEKTEKDHKAYLEKLQVKSEEEATAIAKTKADEKAADESQSQPDNSPQKKRKKENNS